MGGPSGTGRGCPFADPYMQTDGSIEMQKSDEPRAGVAFACDSQRDQDVELESAVPAPTIARGGQSTSVARPLGQGSARIGSA